MTPVAAKNPDAVAVGGTSGTAALQIKQLRELGWEGQFLGSNAGDPGAYVEIAGKEAVEGFLINEPDYASEVWPEETRAIYNEFQRLYPGAQFGLCQYLGYGSAMFYKILEVMKDAGFKTAFMDSGLTQVDAIKMYERFGFTVQRRQDAWIKKLM